MSIAKRIIEMSPGKKRTDLEEYFGLSSKSLKPNSYTITITKVKYTLVITETKDGFTGFCKELPNALSEAKTLPEIKNQLKDAIKLVTTKDFNENNIQF
jgi:predicted RNase H-like HicB family nuclease